MTLIRTALGSVLLLLLTACASLGVGMESPRVKLTSIDLLETQTLSQRFRIGLTLTNPNAVALPIRGMTYSLALAGVEVVQGVTGNVPEIPAYSEIELNLEATADLVGALRLLNQLVNAESEEPMDYRLSAKIDVAGIGRTVRVEETGRVPLR